MNVVIWKFEHSRNTQRKGNLECMIEQDSQCIYVVNITHIDYVVFITL